MPYMLTTQFLNCIGCVITQNRFQRHPMNGILSHSLTRPTGVITHGQGKLDMTLFLALNNSKQTLYACNCIICEKNWEIGAVCLKSTPFWLFQTVGPYTRTPLTKTSHSCSHRENLKNLMRWQSVIMYCDLYPKMDTFQIIVMLALIAGRNGIIQGILIPWVCEEADFISVFGRE